MVIMNYLIKTWYRTRARIVPYFIKKQGTSQLQRYLFVLLLFLLCISTWLVKANAVHKAKLQENIAEDIIRFHVIANSDKEEDQALKLEVKNTLVENLSPLLDKASSLSEARSILLDQITLIHDLADTTIHQAGYDYPVMVSLEECYFPMKVYGDCTFPPGMYQALRVQIGAAEGKNWWCVVFPPLCFVDETYSVVDENSNRKLKHLLTEEEYESLKYEKRPVKVKFKVWESIKKFFK